MRGRRLHFIGIGGAGMSGLARVALSRGAQVSGSDRAAGPATARLAALGATVHVGHDAGHLPGGADVVVSTAIADDNPELAAARQAGARIMHRSELLAELCSERRLIAVAGAHGKTTTAAMLIHALRESGEDLSWFLGGDLPGAGPDGEPSNAAWGEGEWAVAEADESDGSFLRLRPEVAIVTNIELDHHAHWSSTGELREAFVRFCEPARAVVAGHGAEGLPGVEAQIERADGEWRVSGVEVPWPSLAIPGSHNRHNALCALAAARLAGFDPERAATALEGFRGVGRRLELVGEVAGARVFDDYAHHPTEVGATLAALRETSPARLIAVFQPHLYSRTRALGAAFGRELARADVVCVTEVYPAREEPVGRLAGISGLSVAAAAADAQPGKPVIWAPDLKAAAEAVGSRVRPGDAVVTLGAGDVFRVARALVGGR